MCFFISDKFLGVLNFPVFASAFQDLSRTYVIFLVYTITLLTIVPLLLYCKIALSADDTLTFSSSLDFGTIVRRLQRYLDTILKFFQIWKLQINSKTRIKASKNSMLILLFLGTINMLD